jgi:hypothetical protein
MIVTSPPGDINDLVRMRTTPAERWYEALRHHSGLFKKRGTVMKLDAAGNPRITMQSRYVTRAAEASRATALHCARVHVYTERAPQPIPRGSVKRWLRQEARKRGKVWALTGFIVLATLTAAGVHWCSSSAPIQTLPSRQ